MIPNFVNKNIAGRTADEYKRDNREVILARYKQKYRNNRERVLEQLNKKYDCPCGGRYTHCHRPLHFRTKKHRLYSWHAQWDQFNHL